jgi:hypothetical protein
MRRVVIKSLFQAMEMGGLRTFAREICVLDDDWSKTVFLKFLQSPTMSF